jgi:peptide alpha-N-acetyltransferase
VGKKEYAEVQYQKLLSLNAENISYLDSLEASRGLNGELNDGNSERRLNLYRDLIKKYPRSFAIKQRLILYTPMDRFEEIVKDYIILSLQKGVPSLFVTTRDLLYKDFARTEVIENVLSNVIIALERDKKLSGHTELEAPTTILWAYYYMAQHLDWKKKYVEALKMIDKALEHTPTLLEAYMIKAKILKHSGSFQHASEEMDRARKLDLQDRYINSKCAKYMFRAGRIENAEKTVCLFTRV